MKNIHVERAGKRIQRRMFFKALGAGLSVPIALRMARVSLASPPGPKKRFFLFYMPHGVAPEHYNPRFMDSDRTNFALDQTNVSILSPLQPYRPKRRQRGPPRRRLSRSKRLLPLRPLLLNPM